MDLWVAIYRETEDWPKREWYGLASQIRRAALSAGANIAEGSAKRGSREFSRFLDIARGSLTEVSHLLIAARAVGLLDEAALARLFELQASAARLTWLLLRRVRSAADLGR
jgi:four helix bundle protein